LGSSAQGPSVVVRQLAATPSPSSSSGTTSDGSGSGECETNKNSTTFLCEKMSNGNSTMTQRKASNGKPLLGTETIKRGASPPTDTPVTTKESASNISNNTSTLQNQSLSLTSKNIKEDNRISESSLSGPSTTSATSFNKATTSYSTSKTYELHSSSANTMKSSSIEPYAKATEKKETIETSESEKRFYKPPSYSLSTSNITTASSTPIAPKTVTVNVKTNGASTTVTNNFKLPPFPVYVPSTSLPSIKDSSINSKLETSTSGFTSKFKDSKTSLSVTSSTPLNRLPSPSSSRASNSILTSTSTSSETESNFTKSNVTLASLKSNNNTKSFSSPDSSSLLSHQSYNNVYSTLPKTSASSITSKYDSDCDNEKTSTSYTPSYKYSTDFYSNHTSTNGTSIFTSSSSDNNMYRVQYSATNPFLDPVDTSITQTDSSDNMGSFLRSSVSETRKKFEKLDSEEDIK
jgi:hypothetical protein